MSARVVVSCICGLVIITVCVVVRLWRRTVCTLSCIWGIHACQVSLSLFCETVKGIIYIGVCGSYLCTVPESLPMLAVMFSKVTEGDHAVDSSSLVTWKSSIVSWVFVFVFSGRDLRICLHRIKMQVDDSIKRKCNLSETRKIQLKRHYQKQENSENRTNAAQTT